MKIVFCWYSFGVQNDNLLRNSNVVFIIFQQNKNVNIFIRYIVVCYYASHLKKVYKVAKYQILLRWLINRRNRFDYPPLFKCSVKKMNNTNNIFCRVSTSAVLQAAQKWLAIYRRWLWDRYCPHLLQNIKKVMHTTLRVGLFPEILQVLVFY